VAKVAADDKANSKGESKPQPYAPGWVDRFTDWVARLPGPSWLFYLGLGLVLLLVQVIVLWIEGASPTATLLLVQGFNAGTIPYLLALFQILDNRAGTALKTLRPALKTSEEEYGRLRCELTTLPARPTLVASLAAVTIMILIEQMWFAPSSYEALAKLPISAAVFHFIDKMGVSIFGAFLYHTIHQLRVVNCIYTEHTRINLFRMRPLYAFSTLTALTAVSLAVGIYGWIAINPDLLSDPISIGITLLITLLALATFVWPLVGIHRLLVEAKERLLGEICLWLEAAMVEWRQRMDSGNLEGMADLYNALAGLEIQQNALKAIPTWPWRPETARWLVTALVLPVALWIIQFALRPILGP